MAIIDARHIPPMVFGHEEAREIVFGDTTVIVTTEQIQKIVRETLPGLTELMDSVGEENLRRLPKHVCDKIWKAICEVLDDYEYSEGI